MSERTFSYVALAFIIASMFGTLLLAIRSGLRRSEYWQIFLIVPILSIGDFAFEIWKGQVSSISGFIVIAYLFNSGLIMGVGKARKNPKKTPLQVTETPS
jgi:hypothetical protein